jgi:hypothetical protein
MKSRAIPDFNDASRDANVTSARLVSAAHREGESSPLEVTVTMTSRATPDINVTSLVANVTSARLVSAASREGEPPPLEVATTTV